MCTVTSDCDTPAVFAAASRISVGDWLGIQTSTPCRPSSCFLTCAVQFIGSIGVCAR